MNTHRKTAAVAINETIDPGKAGQLHELKIHLSAAGGAGDLTVTLDAAAGTAYDTVLMTQDMTLITDLVWQPDMPVYFDARDKLVVAWDNANLRTFGLEVKFN